MAETSAQLDELDRSLIHALHIDGRAPFSKIGAMLDVSTQTISRRYHRLRAETSLRVVGVATPEEHGQAQWIIRIATDSRYGEGLARDLARRADTSWVKIASSGFDVSAIVTVPNQTAATSTQLLLREISRASGITAMSAHYLMHAYRGGPAAWQGRTSALDGPQRGLLRSTDSSAQGIAGRHMPSGISELLPALQRDGRTSLVDLAQITGWSPAKVARRLEELVSSGGLFFDVELDDRQLGVTIQAMLWMSVVPASLETVGGQLAQHREIAFVAATTGPTNLVAVVLCGGADDLHDYLTHCLGALDAIRSVDVVPIARTVKATGTIAAQDEVLTAGGSSGRLIALRADPLMHSASHIPSATARARTK